MRALLHIFTAALLIVCITYAAAALMPLWSAWILATVLTISMGAYYEYRGNQDYMDTYFNSVGIIPGTLAMVLIRDHWQPKPGLYWLAPVLLFWIFINAAGLIKRMR